MGVTGGVSERQVEDVPWGELEDDLDSLKHRYVGTALRLGERSIEITEQGILTAAVKYGGAVARGAPSVPSPGRVCRA